MRSILGSVLLASSCATDGPDESEVDDCWTYAGMDQVPGAVNRDSCCQLEPCGFKDCWAPPEFTFDFCCEKPACRQGVIAEVQEALRLAFFEMPGPNISQASELVFRAAPKAFNALQRSLRGLRLYILGDFQACDCALAYAVTLLVKPGGPQNVFANEGISADWFTKGFDWGHMFARGWGGIFMLLAQQNIGSIAAEAPGFMSLAFGGLKTKLHFWEHAQREARNILSSLLWPGRASIDFASFVTSAAASALWARLWQVARATFSWRRTSHKCTAVHGDDGRGKWRSCTSWEYSRSANFSSPEPAVHSRNVAAACLLGAPRNVVETYTTLRKNVVEALPADAFVYVPFSNYLSEEIEHELASIGPIVTAIVARDVDRHGMEQRFLNELFDPSYAELYSLAPGPWRAPFYDQMGSSAWVYHMQYVCRRMVESYEIQRKRPYEWVVFARADILWAHRHPPIDLFDARYVHVPFGQDNDFYANGPHKGLNDRHAVVPRKWVSAYFGRWDQLLSGDAWLYLAEVALAGIHINTEQYLHLHLQYNGVLVRRFPPVGFVIHCLEGPQCQHLFRGTSLGRRQWVQTAKYPSELVEVRRTLKDDQRGLHRVHHDWIWTALKPPAAISPERSDPWHDHSIEFACCLSKSGPVSCYKWELFHQCQSIA